jgi:hypothetical protein
MTTGETRLREIRTSFAKLAKDNKGLRALSDADASVPSKCAVLLVAEEHGAQVRMDVFIIGAHVVARSGLGSAMVGSAEIEDRLTVNLTNGYDWDDATFDTPDEMAFILFKHMLRRLAAASDLKSSDKDGVH